MTTTHEKDRIVRSRIENKEDENELKSKGLKAKTEDLSLSVNHIPCRAVDISLQCFCLARMYTKRNAAEKEYRKKKHKTEGFEEVKRDVS